MGRNVMFKRFAKRDYHTKVRDEADHHNSSVISNAEPMPLCHALMLRGLALLSILGETQAGHKDHCFLDSGHRAIVATRAAMCLRILIKREAQAFFVQF